MPMLRVNGADYHVVERGVGESVVFAHGLLMSSAMFEHQIEMLAPRYRCIAFDWRGQGASETTRGGYGIDELTEDAAALLEALDAAPCHFVGLSMGGFVGMRLALRRPELLRSLVLLNTTAEPDTRVRALRYSILGAIARTAGVRPVLGPAMTTLFGHTFLRDPARAGERDRWRAHLLAIDRAGAVRSLKGVVHRRGIGERLREIRVPTLVIAGEEDAAMPRPRLEGLAAGIQGAHLVVVPRAGHSSSVEQPEAVTEAIAGFLAGVS